MTSSPLPVLAVTGLSAEARIAAGTGVVTLAGGGDPVRLALLLQGALSRGARAVISFGIAGGLAPGLTPGTPIVASSIDDRGLRTVTDAAWTERLCVLLPHAIRADLSGVDQMLVGADQKMALFQKSGAAAVDMESHIAARLAALHRVPFAALRVIADPAQRTLPHAATVGMRPDGSTDAVAVLRALARRPADFPALIRTALDARAAFSALEDSRKRLSALLGYEESDGPLGRPNRDAVADPRPGIDARGAFAAPSEAQG